MRDRATRLRRATGQRGYALLVVLAVIALTSLMVAALTSLLFTTVQVNERSDRSGRELRALDSAMEAAINQMRFDPASTGRDACRLEPPVERVEQIRFDGGFEGETDDLVVDVDCDGAMRSDLQSAADQVRLVNPNGYSGAIQWTNASLWPGNVDVPALAASAPNLVHRGDAALQFGAGLTLRNSAAAVRLNGAGPAADGPAIEVAGDYTQGGLGAGGDSGAPCGVLGQPGPLQITALNGTAGPICGVPLEELVLDEDPTGPEAGFPIPTNLVPALAQACPSSKVMEFHPGLYQGGSRMDRLNRFTNRAQGNQFPTCTGPTTFYFHPGVYYLDGTELLFDRPEGYFVAGVPKGWDLSSGVQGSPVAGDPQAELCDPEQSGVTFVVPPQMQIQHRSGRLAMCAAFSPWEGQPPLPAIYQETSFPTEIQRGAWRQQFGVCLATPGLFSRPELDIVDVGGTPSRPTSSRWTAEQRLPSVPTDECRVGRSHRVDVAQLGPEPLQSAHLHVRGKEHFPATLISDRRVMVTVRPGSGTANRVCTTEAVPGVSNGDWMVRVDLLTGSCGNARTGITDDPRTSVPGVLLASEQTLTRDRLNNARIEVTQYITFKMSLFGTPMLITQDYTIDDVQLVVNGAEADVLGPVSTPAPTSDPVAQQGWHDAAAMIQPAGIARPRMPENRFMTGINSWATSAEECPYLLCPVASATRLPNRQKFQHVFEVDDLEVAIPQNYVDLGIDPRVSSLKVRMDVDPTHCGEASPPCEMLAPLFSEDGLDLNQLFRQSYTGTPFTARLELVTVSGRVCSSFKGKVHGAQEIVFDMMDANWRVDGDGCGRQVRNFSDLRSTASPAADGRNSISARVVFETECFRVTGSCHRGRDGALHLVWQVRPPSVKEISLDVASDTYAGATTTSTFTIDATAGPASSSVNIAGRVLLPRSNLDVRWNGDMTEGRPLVTEELVVGALGSHIAAPPVRDVSGYGTRDRYYVCCDPRRAESREVRITASIGERRVQADVLFTDVISDENGQVLEYSPGHRVDVTDWQTCDSGRCSSSE